MATSNSSTPRTSVSVLIAGAGPVGLFEAYLLTKQGIQVRIIEREHAICPLSKGTGLLPGTLEILQFTGLSDRFMRRGLPMIDFKLLIGNEHIGTDLALAGVDSYYNFMLCLEQHRTSDILLEELVKLGVNVEYGWELLDTQVIDKQEEGLGSYVETVIRKTPSGETIGADKKAFIERVEPVEGHNGRAYETQVVRSQYLVAADGGRSTVRHKLNIDFPGHVLPGKVCMWDGTFDSDCDMRSNCIISGTDGKMMLLFPLTNGEVRVAVDELDSDDKADVATALKNLTIEKFEQMASASIAPSTFKIKTTSWLTCFRVNERRAENFIYKNRVFLIGDAAHVHSPRGAQGMNTGFHDAHNLAWKLAFTLNKVAANCLLATYEVERQAMADRAIALSSKLLRQNRANGFVKQVLKRLYYSLTPYLTIARKAVSTDPELAMLSGRYGENAINQHHPTQLLPQLEHQVGVRAKDGPLSTLGFNLNAKEPSQVRVRDLFLGISRFHILVFASDLLEFITSVRSSNQGINVTSFNELAHNIDRFQAIWNDKWTYGSKLNDGYKDNNLFKVHIIACSFVPVTQAGLDVLLKRDVGEGRLYLDYTRAVHEKYGYPWKGGSGGIVVVRPDSYLGYRVNGIQKQAWEDLDQYFTSVLSNA
ncbi:hypothetical protein EC968_004860 [Mortierella alpina]|nr:hypothetical protein EC968_004860 [Mortierella alpina]